jgi:hypothetical protein
MRTPSYSNVGAFCRTKRFPLKYLGLLDYDTPRAGLFATYHSTACVANRFASAAKNLVNTPPKARSRSASIAAAPQPTFFLRHRYLQSS